MRSTKSEPLQHNIKWAGAYRCAGAYVWCCDVEDESQQ